MCLVQITSVFALYMLLLFYIWLSETANESPCLQRLSYDQTISIGNNVADKVRWFVHNSCLKTYVDNLTYLIWPKITNITIMGSYAIMGSFNVFCINNNLYFNDVKNPVVNAAKSCKELNKEEHWYEKD